MKFKNSQEYKDEILKGNKVALSKAITLIESTLSSHQKTASELLSVILPHTGNAVRIGITGVPGAGKSTFIEALGLYLVREKHKVAVLAIDPSSSVTGGSILADKTRMEDLSSHPNAFIRPSPSSTHLGGVAQKTRETMFLCEAAGYDVILVETVGVGQSEITAASMVDFFLVVMLPNAGDELQGIKKGILELADAIIINKADKNNMQNAMLAKSVYENALHILNPLSQTWSPPVLTTSSIEKRGFEEVWEIVLQHNIKMKESGELQQKRQKQSIAWMWNLLDDKFTNHIFTIPEVKDAVLFMTKTIEENKISAEEASEHIFTAYIDSLKKMIADFNVI
ncbi:MAG TPA: methylmalonyl Co-A mutase-associated GTPase MeaB [Lentisphaeria bacterium]|nr:MAG: ATPase/protein kinase [Lentisphaerae bacterium GWF2_38_69]HBM15655.1 methylmalonyl Co-A mutase-associated GTPase MeaB [Lentisphaeria bacterium]